MLRNEDKKRVNQRHILCGFPHMGPERANAWINHFDGTRLTWEISMDEMMEIPGIGRGIAEDLLEVLSDDSGDV